MIKEGVIYDRRKGKPYLEAIKEGWRLLTVEDIKIYNPNVISVKRRVISA